jgi:hypothetical protein
MILNLTSEFPSSKCRYYLLSTTLYCLDTVLSQNVCQDLPPLPTLTGHSLSHIYSLPS